MQATWHVTATDTGSVKVTMVGSEGGDYPNHPRTSLSLAPHASTSMGWCTTGYHTPHSPSYSPHRSPSQNCRSQGLRLRPHSSNSSVSGFGSSSPTSQSESDTGSSGVIPMVRSNTAPVPLTCLFLGKTEEDPADSEGEEKAQMMRRHLSLLDISNSDNEEVHKAAAHIRHARVMSCMLPGETSRFARVMMR